MTVRGGSAPTKPARMRISETASRVNIGSRLSLSNPRVRHSHPSCVDLVRRRAVSRLTRSLLTPTESKALFPPLSASTLSAGGTFASDLAPRSSLSNHDLAHRSLWRFNLYVRESRLQANQIVGGMARHCLKWGLPTWGIGGVWGSQPQTLHGHVGGW